MPATAVVAEVVTPLLPPSEARFGIGSTSCALCLVEHDDCGVAAGEAPLSRHGAERRLWGSTGAASADLGVAEAGFACHYGMAGRRQDSQVAAAASRRGSRNRIAAMRLLSHPRMRWIQFTLCSKLVS